jgi:hypothetical protein
MQGYSKGSDGNFIHVQYNGYLEASMRCYIKGREVPFIPAIIMAKYRRLYKAIVRVVRCPI